MGPDVVADPDHRQWMYLAGHGPFGDKADFIAAWDRFDKAVDNLTYAVIPTDAPLACLPFPRASSASCGSARGWFHGVGFVDSHPRWPAHEPQPRRIPTDAPRFRVLQYRRYEWKCNADNQPSMTTAKRLGFTYEGTFRQDQIITVGTEILRGGALLTRNGQG